MKEDDVSRPNKWLGAVGLTIALAVPIGVATLTNVPIAQAWPAPTVTGDCDGWYVTETATDYDWSGTSYWSIDGSGQFARNQVAVNVPDSSDATTREFTVSWHDANGAALDTKSSTGTRDLSDCEEEVPPPSWSVDCSTVMNTGTVTFEIRHTDGDGNLGVLEPGQSVDLSPFGFGLTGYFVIYGDGEIGGDLTLEDCTPPADVCPNIDGDQATVPDGLVVDDAGNCVTPPPVDACPNLPGVQAPGTDCNPVTPPADVCPNISGTQTAVPAGMVKDGAGNCVTPPPVVPPVVPPVTPPIPGLPETS